jgi:hypothetical protein
VNTLEILNHATDLPGLSLIIFTGRNYNYDAKVKVQLEYSRDGVKFAYEVNDLTVEAAVVAAWTRFEQVCSVGLGTHLLVPPINNILEAPKPSTRDDDDIPF